MEDVLETPRGNSGALRFRTDLGAAQVPDTHLLAGKDFPGPLDHTQILPLETL